MKTKPEQSKLPITEEKRSTTHQQESKLPAPNVRKPDGQVATGFDWFRKWWEIFKQSQNALEQNQSKKPQHNLTYTDGIVYPSAMQTDGR